jgi:hypothetical protein
MMASPRGGFQDRIHGTSQSSRRITSASLVHSWKPRQNASDAGCVNRKYTSPPPVSCTRMPGIKSASATRRFRVRQSRPEYPVIISLHKSEAYFFDGIEGQCTRPNRYPLLLPQRVWMNFLGRHLSSTRQVHRSLRRAARKL